MNLTFSGKFLLHTQGRSFLSFGASTQWMWLLFPENATSNSRRCIGFFCISSHCQPLHGVFWRTRPRPECPIHTPWWKRYMEDVINIVKKEQVDTLFNYLHSNRSLHHIHKAAPRSDGIIPFSDAKYSPIWAIPYKSLYIENQPIMITT